MKKTLLFLVSLLLIAACSGNKPVVVKGTIKGYDGEFPFLVSMTKDFEMDTLKVNEDGTFYLEKRIDEPWTGFICVQTKGNMSVIFIPGEEYTFDVDMTANPTTWNYSGANQDAMDYYEYYRDVFFHNNVHTSDTFKEYKEFWDNIRTEALEKLESVKNRTARNFFEEKVNLNTKYYTFNYAFQLRKRGEALDSDPDFNEFFKSIDLSDENLCKAILSNMLNVKADLYDNSISYNIRYLDAIYELSPTQQVRDSVAAKYLESVFRDGRIDSREEADILLAKASETGADQATVQKYSEVADKILSLAKGCDAVDFEFEDRAGKIFKLSDFKGKVVYIDFWATWCMPCCMQIPYMEKLAAKYKNDKRVACLSISLDKSAEDWCEKLDEDKPFWPQYRIADGGKKVQKAYCFGSIPRFMLFDRNGKIVTVNAPRPQYMDEVVALIDKEL